MVRARSIRPTHDESNTTPSPGEIPARVGRAKREYEARRTLSSFLSELPLETMPRGGVGQPTSQRQWVYIAVSGFLKEFIVQKIKLKLIAWHVLRFITGIVMIGGLLYAIVHRTEYPWYVLPLSLSIGVPLIAMLEDAEAARVGDYCTGAESAIMVLLAWAIAFAMTFGHFL